VVWDAVILPQNGPHPSVPFSKLTRPLPGPGAGFFERDGRGDGVGRLDGAGVGDEEVVADGDGEAEGEGAVDGG
jgi:hypothetical protein